jgi:hypothetical protein
MYEYEIYDEDDNDRDVYRPGRHPGPSTDKQFDQKTGKKKEKSDQETFTVSPWKFPEFGLVLWFSNVLAHQFFFKIGKFNNYNVDFGNPLPEISIF